MQPVEDGPEEVCIIDTILEKQADQQQMQDVLTEECVDCSEEQQGAQDIYCAGALEKKARNFALTD